MSLKSRLSRLSGAGPAAPPESEKRLVEAASSSVLDDLRARMDRILERTRAEPKRAPPRVDEPDGELPFCVEHTAEGVLHVRHLPLSGAHRVGRAPVTAAKTASPELLALLALDPSIASCDPTGALYLDT